MPSKRERKQTLKNAMNILKRKVAKQPKSSKKTTTKKSLKGFFKKSIKNTLKKLTSSRKKPKKNAKKNKKIKGGGVGMPIEYFGGLENSTQWDLQGGNTTWGSSEGLTRGGTMV